MSHLPWHLQEMMGIPDPPKRSKRVAHPTAATPATFDLNWDYSENGPTNPRPQAGVTTFMGPALSQHAGNGKEWPDNHVSCLKAALEILRKHGLTCQLPPEDYTFEEEQDAAAMSAQEKETAYLKEKYFSDMEIKKDGETQIRMTTNCGWICLRCANQEVALFVDENIAQSPHFALGRVEHRQETIASQDANGVFIVQTTGNGERKGGTVACSPCSPGTLFELKKGDKVISKALCSYKNGEMDNAGPTIELVETAAEWQRHGYASRLLDAMEEHFQTIFSDLEDVARVKYNVCYVTNHQACQFFLSWGFEDWDGMGEELGKYLFD